MDTDDVDFDDAYLAVLTERIYQECHFGNAANNSGELTRGEIILLMMRLLGDTGTVYYTPSQEDTLAHTMRKVTALGFQFLERFGAPLREFTDEQKAILAPMMATHDKEAAT